MMLRLADRTECPHSIAHLGVSARSDAEADKIADGADVRAAHLTRYARDTRRISANISANHGSTSSGSANISAISHHRKVAHARVEESTSEWVGDEEHEGGGRGEGGDEVAELSLRRIRA